VLIGENKWFKFLCSDERYEWPLVVKNSVGGALAAPHCETNSQPTNAWSIGGRNQAGEPLIALMTTDQEALDISANQ
jgi:hypothetical protein